MNPTKRMTFERLDEIPSALDWLPDVINLNGPAGVYGADLNWVQCSFELRYEPQIINHPQLESFLQRLGELLALGYELSRTSPRALPYSPGMDGQFSLYVLQGEGDVLDIGHLLHIATPEPGECRFSMNYAGKLLYADERLEPNGVVDGMRECMHQSAELAEAKDER